MKTDKKIGFIGAGNMARAIIGGVIKSGYVCPSCIKASDINAEELKKYAEKTGITAVYDNVALTRECDIIVLSVKPNVLLGVLEEIKEEAAEKTVISIVAGASIDKIKKILGSRCKIIRTMPNTPAMVSEGMTVLCYSENIETEDKEFAEGIFKSVGKVQVMEEKYLNSVIALTSSSPAYFFVMLEAMADGAVRSGIPRNIAYEMAAQAMLGSAKMLLDTKKHPGELKDMVCSPAGTTIEAVAELEKSGFRNAVIEAMKACTQKADNM